MWELQLVALRANRHAWGGHPQLLRPSLVTSGSRMFMFRIWHRSSSKQPVAGKPSGSTQPTEFSVSYFGPPGSPTPAAPEDMGKTLRLGLPRIVHTDPRNRFDRVAASAQPR